MLRNDTKKIQRQLADFALSNTQEIIQGTEQERLEHYRKLIYNIINGALESAYPIAFDLLSQEHWKNIVDDFVMHHKCQNPQLLKMPFELIEFVENQQYASIFKIPFLDDLLKFEWAEMEVHDMPDIQEAPCNLDGDILNDHFVFSPYFQLLTLSYPIHQLKTHDLAELAGEYYILVYRDADCDVNYLQLNQFSCLLFSELLAGESSLLDVLIPVLNKHTPEFKNTVLDEAVDFIRLLQNKGLVRGFKP